MALLPQHEVEIDVLDNPEPEQVFLLGNRWADYGLALFFALAFPVLRNILKATIYEVCVCDIDQSDCLTGKWQSLRHAITHLHTQDMKAYASVIEASISALTSD